MSQPLDGDERLELEYFRETHENDGKRIVELLMEIDSLKMAARPAVVAALTTEAMTKHIDAHVSKTLSGVVKGVNGTLLPRVEGLTAATATLPALEQRLLAAETSLRLVIAELGLREAA